MDMNIVKFMLTLITFVMVLPWGESVWWAVIAVLTSPVFYKPYCTYVGDKLTTLHVVTSSVFIWLLVAFHADVWLGLLMWALATIVVLITIYQAKIDGFEGDEVKFAFNKLFQFSIANLCAGLAVSYLL